MTLGENTHQPQQSLTSRTLSGLFWLSSGTGVQAVLRLMVMVVLARLLTPADFGLVTVAMVVVGFTDIFFLLGIGPAVVQRQSLEPRHLRTGFTISVLFGVMFAGLMWLLTPGIAAFFRLPGLPPVLRVLTVTLPLHSLAVIPQSLLTRGLQFRRLALLDIAAYIVGYGVIGIGLACMGLGVWALVGATLVQTVFSTTTLLIMQPYPKQPLIERQAFKELMYFGGGFTAARVCNFFALQGDNFVVGRCLGVEALGFYGRSYGLMSASVSLFGQVLERILFPALTHIQNEQQRLAMAYRRSVALVALVMLPVSATLCVLAPEVIHVLLGPVWREVIVPFRILVLGMLFRTTYKIGGALARATRAVYGLAWRHATYAALVVVGAWIGQHWGLTGVALGVVGALAIHFILIAQLSLDLTEVAWWDFFAAHIPALLLSSVILTALWVVVTVLRELHISPVLMLITSSAIIVIILLVFLQFAPKLAFGRDGLWMLRMLMDYVSDRFVFPSWLKKWSQSKLNKEGRLA